jgi:enediyne biosynthesis protein E4
MRFSSSTGEAGTVRRKWKGIFRPLPAVLLIAILLVAVWVCWTNFLAPANKSVIVQGTPRPFLFRDKTSDSGVDFTYHNGEEANRFSILESVGGGVALLDYDGDGLLDVFVTGGGHFGGSDKKDIQGYRCRLYKNLGNWKFRDVTEETGLDGIRFYSHGTAVTDYNRDGWPDILVTGWGNIALLRNDPIDAADPTKGRKFTDVTRQAGLANQTTWATSAAWGDLDGDGFPDLYVCQYVNWSFANDPECTRSHRSERDLCPPRAFDALPHLLFRNNGDGTFSNVSVKAGLHAPRRENDYAALDFLSPPSLDKLRRSDREKGYGKGLGVVLVDLNGDGRPEIYVANDTTDKFLFINRSEKGQLRLEDMAMALGVARDENGRINGSMGLDAGDYDASGRASLLVTNFQDEFHALYRNRTVGVQLSFQSDVRATGFASLGRQYVGFGTGFIDVDNDGREDIIIVNGHVFRHPPGATVRQRPVLLRNLGPPNGESAVQFGDASSEGGDYFQGEHPARGMAIGDLDNDGRLDLVVSHVNEPLTLLRNESDSRNHWLGIELVSKGHADIVGAKLVLEVGGRRLTRFAKGGGSYLSSGDRRHVFGLGKASTFDRLTITWPDGLVRSFDGLEVDRYWQIREGEGQARELPRTKSLPE